MKFALKGSNCRTLPTAHSSAKLEIRGLWTIQGPQIVGGEGGAPEWVYDLFQKDPCMMKIAISYESGGVVWSRPNGGGVEE